MKFVVGIILFLLALNAFARSKVSEVLDERHLVVKLSPQDYPELQEKMMIISHSDGKIAAVAKVRSLRRLKSGRYAYLDVLEILEHRMVVPKDHVVELTADNLKRYKIPGHFALTLSQEISIPPQYRELAYLGVFGSEGHTLAKKEVLISPFTLQYGLWERFTVRVNNGLYLDGIANLGGKWMVLAQDWGKLTLHGLGGRKVTADDWVVQGGMILTFPSNSRFQTHIAVNANFDDIEETNAEAKKYNLFQDSDVRTIYEYVTDGWDRLLFGPVFNFENQTVGSTVSYMFIWDNLHLNLGVASKDVTELEFGSKGYYFLFDFFWRY